MIRACSLDTGLQWPSLWRAYVLRSSRHHHHPDRTGIRRTTSSSLPFMMHGWIPPLTFFLPCPCFFFFSFHFIFSFLSGDYASHDMHPCLYDLNCIFDGNHVDRIVLTGHTGTHIIPPMSIHFSNNTEFPPSKLSHSSIFRTKKAA
jgi:hypothetical protein